MRYAYPAYNSKHCRPDNMFKDYATWEAAISSSAISSLFSSFSMLTRISIRSPNAPVPSGIPSTALPQTPAPDGFDPSSATAHPRRHLLQSRLRADRVQHNHHGVFVVIHIALAKLHAQVNNRHNHTAQVRNAFDKRRRVSNARHLIIAAISCTFRISIPYSSSPA